MYLILCNLFTPLIQQCNYPLAQQNAVPNTVVGDTGAQLIGKVKAVIGIQCGYKARKLYLLPVPVHMCHFV